MKWSQNFKRLMAVVAGFIGLTNFGLRALAETHCPTCGPSLTQNEMNQMYPNGYDNVANIVSQIPLERQLPANLSQYTALDGSQMRVGFPYLVPSQPMWRMETQGIPTISFIQPVPFNPSPSFKASDFFWPSSSVIPGMISAINASLPQGQNQVAM